MLTVLAFVVALGVLIAVHEYGHYRVAVAFGVKVLRFSVGFGKPLLRWRSKASGTEFVLAACPWGGDVRMLSSRVPSLTLESSFGRTFPRPYIRGLGNTDFDLNASQPVSLI